MNKHKIDLEAIEAESKLLIDQSFKTDLIFLYSYSEIAFTAIAIVIEQMLQINLDKLSSLLEIVLSENMINIINNIKDTFSNKSLYTVDDLKVKKYLKEVKSFLKKNEEYSKHNIEKKK